MDRFTALHYTQSDLLDDVCDLVLVEPPLDPGEGRGHVRHGAQAAQLHAVPHVPPHPATPGHVCSLLSTPRKGNRTWQQDSLSELHNIFLGATAPFPFYHSIKLEVMLIC